MTAQQQVALFHHQQQQQQQFRNGQVSFPYNKKIALKPIDYYTQNSITQ